MPVLVKGAAESVLSEDVEPRDLCRVGDRIGKRMKRGCAAEGPVRPVPVIERLELAQGVEEVALVPDEGVVQQLAPARLYPAFDDRVHAGHSDAALDDRQSGIGQYGVE